MSFRNGAKRRFFCSSVPKRMRGVKARELAIIVVYIPAHPQASSSLTRAVSKSPRPTAAVLGRDRAGQEADLEGLAHDVLGKGVALIVGRRLGTHLVGGEIVGHLLEGDLVFRQFKIDHDVLSPGGITTAC